MVTPGAPAPTLGSTLTPITTQALISTAPPSSCSRVKCGPTVRSARERAGELGARGGDVCVRGAAGEHAGERG